MRISRRLLSLLPFAAVILGVVLFQSRRSPAPAPIARPAIERPGARQSFPSRLGIDEGERFGFPRRGDFLLTAPTHDPRLIDFKQRVSPLPR